MNDPGIQHLLVAGLSKDGFSPHACADAERAFAVFERVQPLIVITEVLLPGMDGLSFCRRMRTMSQVPIIVLTVMDDPREAAAALEAGADDYVRKPFEMEELRARVKAVLRRGRDRWPAPARVTAGALVVDSARRVATVRGNELVLTPTEFALLSYLAEHADRVLTHGQVLESVWGQEYTDSPHTLRVTLSRLRQKLEMEGAAMIETLPRIGYRLLTSDDGVSRRCRSRAAGRALVEQA